MIEAHLDAAAAAIEDGRWTDACAALLEAWNGCRCARIARLVAAVDLRLPSPAPLTEKRVNRREHEWITLVRAGDDASLRRALAAPWPAFPSQAMTRVYELASRPSARVSNALIALHRSSQFVSAQGSRLSRLICEQLIAHGDHAITEELARLEKLPLEANRLGPGILRRLRPEMPHVSPVADAALARIEQLLATSTKTPRESLLAAIYEAPHDDGPRIVFADVLTTEGDPRGEFITLQIQRGRTGEPSRRENQLLKAVPRAWFEGIDADGATDIEFARGFPYSAALSAGEIRAPGWATIERLVLFNQHVFKGAKHLRGLRELHGIGATELRTATLPSYELDLVGVRDFQHGGLAADTPFAPRILGLAQMSLFEPCRDAIRMVRGAPIVRRAEAIRLGLSLRSLKHALALASETGFSLELTGSYHLFKQNQWAVRIDGTALHLHWAGNLDRSGDVAYESIVPILTELAMASIGSIVVTAVADPNPAVKPALIRLLERWPRLRSMQVLSAGDAVAN